MVDISIAEMVQQVLLEQGMKGLTRLQALNLVCLRYGIINDDICVELTHGCEEFERALALARSELRDRLLPRSLSNTSIDALPVPLTVPAGLPPKLLLTTTSTMPLQIAFVPPAATLLTIAATPLAVPPLSTGSCLEIVDAAMVIDVIHDIAIASAITRPLLSGSVTSPGASPMNGSRIG